MRAIILSAIAAGAALAAGAATAADTCPTNQRLGIGGIAIQPCFSQALDDPIVGGLDQYYGQVAMNVSSGGTYDVDKGVGRYLRSMFGIRDDFTAAVTLELRKGGALIYQKPLFTVAVTSGDKSKISVSSTSGQDIDISPIFLLEGGVDAVQATIKVNAVSKRGSAVMDTVKGGVDAAAALGGHGWLVTAFATEAFMTFAAKAEAALNSYYSDELDGTLETELKYGSGLAYKAVAYQITLPAAKRNDPPISVMARVQLKTRRSLVTDAVFTGADGIVRPNTLGAAEPSSRWANEIIIKQSPDTRLGTQIDSGGVPRKLADLSLPAGAKATDVVARKVQVEAACAALSTAIETGAFRLNDHDRHLVLYDELRRAGVFKVYDAAELDCTSSMVPIWARYGITKVKPAEPRTPLYPSTPDQRVARLTTLATHWAIADEATRRAILPSSFRNPVTLTARPDMIAGYPAPVRPDPEGAATWQIQPALLAGLSKSCFGNFKPPAADQATATAFARFVDDTRLYLVRIIVSDSQAFGPEGPMISAITLREATQQDIASFDLNGNCIAAR